MEKRKKVLVSDEREKAVLEKKALERFT